MNCRIHGWRMLCKLSLLKELEKDYTNLCIMCPPLLLSAQEVSAQCVAEGQQ